MSDTPEDGLEWDKTTPRCNIWLKDYYKEFIEPDADDVLCLARYLERELAAMTARVAELERDAGRYRRLKELHLLDFFVPKGQPLTEDEFRRYIDRSIDSAQEQP